jgi:hypothetical protein
MWRLLKKIFRILLPSKKSHSLKMIVDDIESHQPSEGSPLLKTHEDIARYSGKLTTPPCLRNRTSRAAHLEQEAPRPVGGKEIIQVFPPVRKRYTLSPGVRFHFESNQTRHHYSDEPAMVLVEDREGKPCVGMTLSLKLFLGMQKALLARRELLVLESRTEAQRRFYFTHETNIIERMRSLSRELSHLYLEDADNVEGISTIKQEIRDNEREYRTLVRKNEELEKGLLEEMKELNRLQEEVDEVLDGVFVNAHLLESANPDSGFDFTDPEPLPEEGEGEPDVLLEGDALPTLKIDDGVTNPSHLDGVILNDFDEFFYDDKARIIAWSENVSPSPADVGAEENKVDDQEVDDWDVRSIGMMSINGLALGVDRVRIDRYEKMKAIIRAKLERDDVGEETEVTMER